MGAGPRLAVLGGLTAGLAVSPLAPGAGGRIEALAAVLATVAVILLRPRTGSAQAAWLALLAGAASLIGLVAGAARLGSIDAGAYSGAPGAEAAVEGSVVSVPRRSDGAVRVAVQTADGRLLVESPEPVSDLPIGTGVRASGQLARPPDYYRATLRRQGISTLLRARGITLTGASRGGIAGRLDAIRDRAAAGLGEGMPAREAALARGFVLGQDDSIDRETVLDFRRSGLSHLLAVSGQNVVLLALLAAPLMAALGIALRARLLWTCALIAVYVPLAGGGPSIQRAGVMGAAGILAALAGRPASRAYALLLAATVTLALNPRSSGDVGWQLSFAAVAGIFLLAGPIRAALTPRRGAEGRAGAEGWRRALAEGAAVTIAATIATAPLIAHHFGTLSLTSLLANLLALPAVAPAMWLGMISAALAQIPGFPLAPVNFVNSLLLGYIAQIAAWLGRPSWAQVNVGLGGPLKVAAAYVVLLAATGLGLWALARRSAAAGSTAPPRRPAAPERGARPERTGRSEWTVRSPRTGPPPLTGRRWAVTALAAVAAAALAFVTLAGGGASDGPPRVGLRVRVLDIGQGDAILLQPARSSPILVDGGPPGDDLAQKLRSAGVDTLAAAIVTHDQSDHAGGIREILGDLPIHRLVYAEAGRGLLGEANRAGAEPYGVAAGSEIRSGALRIEVLWPPRSPLERPPPGSDPNAASLVLLARWRGFSMLLTGDAEAEAVPIDPGPVDVLKVSHHGSEDAGLEALLDRTVPSLAVVSVGEENPYGHPVPSTLATLRSRRIRVMRTDRDGTVVIDVTRGRFAAEGAG